MEDYGAYRVDEGIVYAVEDGRLWITKRKLHLSSKAREAKPTWREYTTPMKVKLKLLEDPADDELSTMVGEESEGDYEFRCPTCDWWIWVEADSDEILCDRCGWTPDQLEKTGMVS